MIKWFLRLIFLLVILAAAIYFGGGYVMEYAARQMIPAMRSAMADRGLQLHDLSFNAIRFTSYNCVTVFGLATDVGIPSKEMPLEASFAAERLDVALVQLRRPAVRVSCDQFSLYADRTSDIPGTTFGRFDHGYWSSGVPIELNQLKTELNRYMVQLKELFSDTVLSTDMRLRALVTLQMRGKQAQAYLYTVQDAEGTRLRFESKDIQKAAETFALELSPDEAEIIALYPVRAPVIMRLTSEAKTTARDTHKRNATAPEDAYRHVLWSYLLTRQFDADFAQKVTDAHEILPTNTRDERRMDFINNRIGRGYALSGIPQDRILSLVINDPQVVRRPEEAQFKN
jgi:hypothetical protein